MRLVRFLLVIAMLFVVARLVDVQVLHAGAYESAARGESSITVSLPSLRGGIYARDGSPLAMSVATDDVVADDFQVAHPVKTALALSPLIHVPATTLAAELHRPSGYVVLARQVAASTGQQIDTDAIPGITTIDDAKRVVPNGNLASPVIGFTNAAGQGAAGLEYGDNQRLAGVNGKETIVESPSGVAIPQSPVTDEVATTPGTGLELTLDTQLQYESEQALAKAIESSNAVSGTAVVMDVKTGQILSMANLVATHPAASGAPTTTTSSADCGCRPDRAVRRRQRGSEQPVGDAALRAGLRLQVGDVLGRTPERADQPQLRLHRSRPDTARRLDVPRRRVSPDRAVDGHGDPGAVLQHRDVGDRSGRGRGSACSTR